MFLVGVFGEKARLLQWLVFFSGVSDPSTFTVNRWSKYYSGTVHLAWQARYFRIVCVYPKQVAFHKEDVGKIFR